jgi:hypothetical protein
LFHLRTNWSWIELKKPVNPFFLRGVAFGQTPLPRLPLNANDAVNVAKAKAWVIEHFQVPADAKITRFSVSASGTRAFII